MAVKRPKLPKPVAYKAERWQGLQDVPEPTLGEASLISRGINVYLPPGTPGGSFIGRPGLDLAGAQQGSVGNRTAQWIGQFTKQAGTEYTVLILQGEIYTYNWGTDAWTKVVSTANLTTASITLSGTVRVHCVPYFNTLVISDGVNVPFTWDGASGAGGLVKLTNAPVAYGQPVVYYSKLAFIKNAERDMFVWSEEAAANTGYEAGGYNNAWTVPNPKNERMYALAATNASLTVFWSNSITEIQGAVNSDFSTSGTRSSVSSTVGTLSPSGVKVLDEGILFVDAEGRCYLLESGATAPTQKWFDVQELVAAVSRTAIAKVQIVEDRGSGVVLVGYISTNATQPDTWLCLTRNGGQLFPSGVWTGFSAQSVGEVKDGNGDWTWMHAGVDEGYLYRHGRPGGTLWDDEFAAGTVPISHEVHLTAMGADPDAEKVFDEMTIEVRTLTDATMTVSYITPRGTSMGQDFAVVGGGPKVGYALVDVAVLVANAEDQRVRVGLNGRGRWIQPVILHSAIGEQFGLTAVRVTGFVEALEPELV